MGQAPNFSSFPASIIVIASLLGGCFELGDSVDPSTGSNSSAFADVSNGSSPSLAPNSAPTISGAPGSVAIVGNNWSFTPSASDADGDRLTFSIDNQPDWAEFDVSSGRLSGTPQLGQEGLYGDVSISVSDGEDSAELLAFSIDVQSTSSNGSPAISGTAPGTATVGQAYEFTPNAADPDGNSLTFSIANAPSWAAFNPGNGQLSGTPQAGDSAVYDNIVISVTDGELTASLPAFSINVSQGATTSVTLSWTPPTQNEDGTPLNDLAAYKIYYGLSEGNYSNEIRVDNPGLTTYVVDNLTPNTYYFVSTSVNRNGIESDFSNVARAIVN